MGYRFWGVKFSKEYPFHTILIQFHRFRMATGQVVFDRPGLTYTSDNKWTRAWVWAQITEREKKLWHSLESRFLFGFSQKIHFWHKHTHTQSFEANSTPVPVLLFMCVYVTCSSMYTFTWLLLLLPHPLQQCVFFHVCLPLWFIAGKNLILSLFWDGIFASI